MPQHGNPLDVTDIIRLYETQFLEHGDCARGFFWARQSDAHLRFKTIVEGLFLDKKEPVNYTLLDFGCGTGDLIPYLPGVVRRYIGVEACEEMRELAKKKYPQAGFRDKIPTVLRWDYSVVSGTFNLKGDFTNEEWEYWVRMTCQKLWAQTRTAIAINFLLSKPDWVKKEMWYPYAPDQIITWFDNCSTNIIENYGLNSEWTLIVRRLPREGTFS